MPAVSFPSAHLGSVEQTQCRGRRGFTPWVVWDRGDPSELGWGVA